jgi:heme exporter protein A
MSVRLRHVSKTFGPVRALVNVTVELEPGTVTIIEGPNGSGKTTLLGVLGTLIQPTSGEVDWGDGRRSASDVRKSLGWVGHDTLCYPDLTARENVELAARLAGVEDVAKAWEAAAERFAVRDLHARTMRDASRGQRQRVALARAVIHRPSLLLLDEPSTGLDALSVDRVVAVIDEESTRGATVVVITHDSVFAKRMNGKSFQMDRGRLRAGSTLEGKERTHER